MIGRTNAGGGAGINFKVVGGTVQPQGKENLIWVNTSTPITNWVVSPNQPENPTEGMVWIKTGASENCINIVKKNAVEIGLVNCSQFVSGDWLPLVGYYFDGSQWKQFSETELVLFRDGVLNPAFGGFGDAKVTANGLEIAVKGDSSSSTQESHSVTSGNAVDLTTYKKFVFTASTSNYDSRVSIVRDSTSVVSQGVGKTSATYEVDISELTGFYNVQFTALTWYGNATLYVSEAHFEA